jgi:hypothetical protein
VDHIKSGAPKSKKLNKRKEHEKIYINNKGKRSAHSTCFRR